MNPKDLNFTPKDQWILDYIKVNAVEKYLSPTEIGRAYGESKGNKGYHSSASSRSLLKLTRRGLADRNELGHYKYIKK